MNRLSLHDRARILGCLVEGNSMRATSRMCDVSINTVTKLLVDVGAACNEFQDRTVRNLSSKRIQCDEIWAFCGMKERNVPAEQRGTLGIGDVYTWTALDADSKLIVSFLVGRRDSKYAHEFMHDVAARLANRIQLTTDGHGAYLEAAAHTFGDDVDFAQLIKIYKETGAGAGRYSPAECIGCKTKVISGDPDAAHISTSYAERQNLTMRMSMCRFTRLTNAFSKKFENHGHSLALYFVFYNWMRKHKAHGKTPAMAAGLTDKPMLMSELCEILDNRERHALMQRRQGMLSLSN